MQSARVPVVVVVHHAVTDAPDGGNGSAFWPQAASDRPATHAKAEAMRMRGASSPGSVPVESAAPDGPGPHASRLRAPAASAAPSTTPRSVMSDVTRATGVTSNAGLNTFACAGAQRTPRA